MDMKIIDNSLDSIEDQFAAFIAHYHFILGSFFCNQNKHTGVSTNDYFLSTNQLFSFRWVSHRVGKLFLISDKHDLISRTYPSIDRFIDPFLYQNTKESISIEFVRIVENKMISMFKRVGGARQLNRLSGCCAPFHKSKSYLEYTYEQSNDVWWCQDCIDICSIKEENTVSATVVKKNSRIVNNRLRYEIFERDDFTCKICGRSPKSGDAVKLHIDHIYPVSLGGITVRENLQTLCQQCNIRKSNKVLTS